MAKLTIVKNPFDNSDGREILDIEPSKKLCEYAPEGEFHYVANGAIVDGDYVVQEDDWCAIVPMVGHGWNSNDWAGLAQQAVGVVGAICMLIPGVGWIAGAAIMAGVMAANYLISTCWVEQPGGGGSSGAAESQTYSWDRKNNSTVQGFPIPVTYGRMRTCGQVIGQYVISDGDKQYLNMLLCCGEGVLDDIGDIKLNDQPIDYFYEVAVAKRLGANNQPVIPNFGDTYSDVSVGRELKLNDRVSMQMKDSAQDGVRVAITFPEGLYGVKDDGSGLVENGASLSIYARPDGGAEYLLGDVFAISASRSPIFREWQYPLERGKSYTITVVKTAGGEDNKHFSKAAWSYVTSVYADDFQYNNVGLISIKALATSQLSGGTPRITWVQERKNVLVWNGSGYVPQLATNPAWAAYDMLHYARDYDGTIEVYGVSKESIDFDAFQAWADFCTQNHYDFNFILDTACGMMQALQYPETIGRGKVFMKGSNYTCMFDSPDLQPTQLFSVGNIVIDSFKENFTPIHNRANAVEVTYYPKSRNYDRATLICYDKDYDLQQPKHEQVTLMGCTDYEQAYKHAAYYIKANRYIRRTAEFTISAECIACSVGDVVLVQHDVTQWGEGGRIVEADVNHITLDRTVAFGVGKIYQIRLKIGGKMYLEEWTAAKTETTNTIQLYNYARPDYGMFATFALGIKSGTNCKPFKVVGISRSEELTAKITGIEYIASVYDDSVDVPIVIEYAEKPKKPETPKIDTCNQKTWKTPEGEIKTLVYCSWRTGVYETNGKRPSNAAQTLFEVYYVMYSEPDLYQGRLIETAPWQSITTTTNNDCAMDATTHKRYRFKVVSVFGFQKSDAAYSVEIFTGSDDPPPDVKDFFVEQLADLSKRFWWTYAYPDPNDVMGFELRCNNGVNYNWDSGTRLHDGIVANPPFETKAMMNGKYTAMIKAVDNAGNYSINPACCYINMGDDPIDNIVVEVDYRLDRRWSGEKVNLKRQLNPTDGFDDLVTNIPNNPPFEYIDDFQPEAGGTFSLHGINPKTKMQNTGNVEFFYSYYNSEPMWTIVETRLMWNADPAVLMWKDTKDLWIPYRSKITLTQPEGLRVKAVLPDEDCVLRVFIAVNDVPDIKEYFNDFITSNTTFTPIRLTRQYRKIKAISYTLEQRSGFTAIYATVEKEAQPYPTITTYDVAGAITRGCVDILVQGY